MPTTHHLRLTPTPFTSIQNSTKTIEVRLYDEKRQAIMLGDELIFANTDDPSQTVRVRVIGLLRYPTFAQLFAHHDPVLFGGSSAAALTEQIHRYYTSAQEDTYGVLGIHIELLS